MANSLKTVFLLGLLTGVLILMGGAFGGRIGMIYALIFAAVINMGSYWFSDKIVLARYRAKEISPQESPRLYNILQSLSANGGIPMPKLYVIPSQSPNAFATGRNERHAAVAVTEGLLKTLDDREIAGVIAHELSHIRNSDILIGAIAATVAGAIMMLATMAKYSFFFFGRGGSYSRRDVNPLALLAAAIFAPFAAMLIQLAVSRSREFLADESGARLAGSPMGLASALEKLDYYSHNIPFSGGETTAHMFIVNPLSAQAVGGLSMRLFSTHPPIEERIARLRAMNLGVRS